MRILKLAKHTGWGLADSAFSSLTNFALGVLVARAVSPREFGAFGLVFAAYLLMLGISRSINTGPLVVRFSGSPVQQWSAATGAAAGATVAIGVVAGLLLVLTGIWMGSPIGPGLIALGITLPGLLLQDGWRQVFFADNRGAQAFLNDLIWAIVLFSILGIMLPLGRSSVSFFMLAWGGSATVAGLAGILQSHIVPRVAHTLAWWNSHRDLGPRYLGEFVAISGSNQLVMYGTGAVAGLGAAGGLRAGQILLGPFNVVFEGIWLVSVPLQVRILKQRPGRMVPTSALLSVVLATTALMCGLLILLLPDAIGRELLGASWTIGREVVPPLTLALAGLGIIMGATSGLRALGAAKRSLRVRIVMSVAVVVGGLVGAALSGAYGAAAGRAIALLAAAGLWWRQLIVSVREHELATSSAAGPEEDFLITGAE
jgi:O-antigen/teichoic acid export membrane protein